MFMFWALSQNLWSVERRSGNDRMIIWVCLFAPGHEFSGSRFRGKASAPRFTPSPSGLSGRDGPAALAANCAVSRPPYKTTAWRRCAVRRPNVSAAGPVQVCLFERSRNSYATRIFRSRCVTLISHQKTWRAAAAVLDRFDGIESRFGHVTPPHHQRLILLVGVTRFERATPASRRQCSTRLSYTPMGRY